MDFNSEFQAHIFIGADMVNNGSEAESPTKRCLFEKGEKVSDLDLELAAEIGKALLERNRELEFILRTAQESKEEQMLKAQFFEQQAESLKESLEEQTKTCEQFENQIFELNDKYTQLKIDYKTLNNKNKRFWETIETLENKCESYKCRIDRLEEEKDRILGSENAGGSTSCDNEKISNEEEAESCFSTKITELEEKIDQMQETVKELKIQHGIDSIEKEELKAELEDVSTENQILQHQVSLLENEVEDWKVVFEKAQKYKQLADKYCSGYDPKLSVDPSSQKEKRLPSKAASHEVLNDSPLCGAADLLATRQRYLSSSVTHLNQPPKNLSVLSELDSKYHSLVQRYESLLNKYQHETTTGHKRSEKVQRAIQTLSWDFSSLDFQMNPLNEHEEKSTSQQTCHEEKDFEEEPEIDFRKLFVEIFAKLKESRDFDSGKQSVDS